ncbi:hypothetical protein LTR53_010041 [Teratosphaeriaceae sp. CCFEE 6253]|nr:hypothetical protein LTR53_010041 [Teratosphaeriaceae sp. CCFEE 6253]
MAEPDHDMADSTQEDEDLKTAIALSLGKLKPEAVHGDARRETDIEASHVPMSMLSRPGTGLAAFDRQAMEDERLARLASKKRVRERSISPPSARNPRKAPKLEATTVDMPSGARLNMFATLVQEDQASRKSGAANEANKKLKFESQKTNAGNQSLETDARPTHVGLSYPKGAVKKTWAFGHARTGDDIKLEEVLEPRTLRTAVLSAFQWDTDWVLSKLQTPPNGGTTKCVFVMQAKDDALKQQMLKETEGMRPFLRLCFPPMPGAVHCMHSKLMLLFHAEKLRIAVPTANLLNFDWGETGLMENSVFLIDLPRLNGGLRIDAKNLTSFSKEVLYFLEQQTVDQDVRDGILGFDFGATKDMAFVHTTGGTFYDEQAERTGLPGLGRAVRSLGLQTQDLEIDFAASSIGSLNDEYLRATHAAVKGVDVLADAKATVSEAKSGFFQPAKAKNPPEAIRDKMRIYFPTQETVRSSTAGAAGTICLSRQWYENMPFPRSVFRDYVSTRQGLLSHNKILYARGKQETEPGGAAHDVAWVYVGSSNMSESAWGKVLFDKKARKWKVNCRNWECGVLLPVPAENVASTQAAMSSVSKAQAEATVKKERSDSETESEASEDEGAVATAIDGRPSPQLISMDVFKGFVSMPFEYPARTYDGRDPWYFKEGPG